MTWLLRFFEATDPMPRWLQILTFVIGCYAVAISVMDPNAVDESLAVLLLWQMLCASTGFSLPAASGHFDPVLVRVDRYRVAIAHAFHSIWPVMLLWLAVAAVSGVVHRTAPLALEPGRFASFIFVSIVAWALGLRAPRLTAGALWLVAIVAAVTTRVGPDQYAAVLAAADGTLREWLHAAALAMACPFLMLGDSLPARDGTILMLLTASAVVASIAVQAIVRRDYPLEASL